MCTLISSLGGDIRAHLAQHGRGVPVHLGAGLVVGKAQPPGRLPPCEGRPRLHLRHCIQICGGAVRAPRLLLL